jgi:hypothetical protein
MLYNIDEKKYLEYELLKIADDNIFYSEFVV